MRLNETILENSIGSLGIRSFDKQAFEEYSNIYGGYTTRFNIAMSL